MFYLSNKSILIHMRLLLSFVLLFSLCLSGFSQESIKIKYKETNFLGDNMNLPPQFAQNMPKSFDSNKILYATESKALYVVNTEDVDPNAQQQRWGRRGANEEIFTDSDNDIRFTFTDLFGKEFLVEDELTRTPWKLHSGEQRDILGYTCVKATYIQDSTEVTAWFTTQLPFSFGPSTYSGLPGTILALTYGENRVMLATSVEKDPAKMPAIEKPKKGDAITREKFTKLAEEKRKEMQQMYGNRQGGQFRTFNGN